MAGAVVVWVAGWVVVSPLVAGIPNQLPKSTSVGGGGAVGGGPGGGRGGAYGGDRHPLETAQRPAHRVPLHRVGGGRRVVAHEDLAEGDTPSPVRRRRAFALEFSAVDQAEEEPELLGGELSKHAREDRVG